MSALDKLLARVGKTRASVAKDPRTRLGKLLRRDGVPDSPEVRRVRGLPRRVPPRPEVVEALHELVQVPGCAERMRPAQVDAALDIVEYRRLFAPLRVGAGKTLITLLAARLLGLDPSDVLLLIPANHRKEKIPREFKDYRARGWLVDLPTLASYHDLSNDPELLDRLDPKAIVSDEAHSLKDLASGRTRRAERWLAEHPEVPLMLLSGTLIDPSIMRWHHLAEWSLGPEMMPLPVDPDEARVWAQALDEPDPRKQLGPVLNLGSLSWVVDRDGWGRFIAETPGIVSTPTQGCSASIEISRWRPRVSPKILHMIEEVAETGCRPDGELLSEAEIVDVQSQLALGFYYVWDPLPPAGWREARSEWLDLVAIYKRRRARGLDTESEIRAHIEIWGPESSRRILSAWDDARRNYKPPRKPVWLSDVVLQQARNYACEHNVIVWHRYRAVGERFETLSGGELLHFGDQGCDARGRYIEDHDGQPCSASIASNGTGRNLQAWSSSLVLTPPASPEPWEQLIGRTHREGQKADLIRVAVIEAIDYHREVLTRVRGAAEHLSKVAANAQKLTLATWV